jgi:hypothetical protein
MAANIVIRRTLRHSCSGRCGAWQSDNPVDPYSRKCAWECTCVGSRSQSRIVRHPSQLLVRRFATAASDVAELGPTRTPALMDPDEEVELLSPDEAQITERAAEMRVRGHFGA